MLNFVSTIRMAAMAYKSNDTVRSVCDCSFRVPVLYASSWICKQFAAGQLLLEQAVLWTGQPCQAFITVANTACRRVGPLSSSSAEKDAAFLSSIQGRYFQTFKEPCNRFQGFDSASLCRLAGRYDNPIPARFLAPTYCFKIPAQNKKGNSQFSSFR